MKFSARFTAFLVERSNGVCFRVELLDEDNNQAIVQAVGVVYTPDVARRVAHDILVQCDKADALGGPSAELLASNTDKYERRGEGS